MPTDARARWLEISPYLDEALDLDEPVRQRWLHELELRMPAIARELRALLDEREKLTRDPLLSDDFTSELYQTDLSGRRLGAYTLERVLGQGGMGTVWLASRSDGRYEGRVAVKLLNAALVGRPTEQRFVREGSVLAKLRHPNIAQLVDAGVAPSAQPYLVLEYVEGEHIDRYVSQSGLDIEARVRLFLDVLAAVAHAHTHLIIHRDIKPSNILVTTDGQVKLLDFGVAALLASQDSELTREIEAGLTPQYAAPEQILKQPVTTATDVYALGLVLFMLLTGRHAFELEGKSATEVARITLDDEAPHLSQVIEQPALVRALRGDLDNIVAKALKKDAEERYSSAEAFAQDLQRFLTCQPVSARPDAMTYRAAKFVRRHRGGVLVGLALVMVLLAATFTTTEQMIEARRQRDAALYQSRRAEFQGQFAYQILSDVGGDGRPISVEQLMDKGMEILDRSYGDDPRFVIDMLVHISGRYMDLGDTNGEYRALVKAESVARGMGDPERLTFVQCNTVETELALGRPDAAYRRMEEGLANLAKIVPPSWDRQTDCGIAHARLLWAQSKLPEAIDAAIAVAALFESANKTDDLSYRTITSMLEVMLSQEDRRREALEWNRRRMVAIEQGDGQSTISMSNVLHNRAYILEGVGEMRAAFELQRDIVSRLVAQQSLDTMPAVFASRLGFYQVRVEETEAGMAWLDRGVSVSMALNNHSDRIATLLTRARARVLLHRFDPALDDLLAAERLVEENPSDNREALRLAHLVRAELLMARSQAAPAREAIDGLLAEVGYPKRRIANRLADMLTLKSRAELALGLDEAALDTARNALEVAQASAIQPERSADVGAALLAIANAQLAAGDVEAAKISARRAAGALSAGLGQEHSETRAALLLQR